MKNYIFFSIILCSFINPIFAQFSQGVVNAGNISFQCDSSRSDIGNGFEIKISTTKYTQAKWKCLIYQKGL